MADLKAVIRLHRWQIDDKQRALAVLRDREAQLEQELMELDRGFAAEQAAAARYPEAAFIFATYARAFAKRRERQEEAIARVKTQIAAALDELSLAFQDLKRFELAQESRQQERRRELTRKENAFLDESGMNAFRRRQERTAEEG